MAQNHSARPSANINGIDILGETVVNTYSTVSSVASATPTTIVSYTVPAADTFYLTRVEFSGENIAFYELLIDGTVEAAWRTYFGGDLSGQMIFDRGLNKGFPVNENLVILLRVTHNRPMVGNFEGRIYGVLKD